MVRYGFPVLYTLFLWWFSTGAIFFLDSRPVHTFRWSMAGGTALMAAAVWFLTQTGADVSLTGTYAGFTIGLVLWGWLELGYYMGFMMGPRREGSPAGCGAWQHFRHAVATTLYHELAAVALAALIWAVTWDMPNKLAFWTFAMLWGMQLSAKLNVFLGVPNLAEDYLPRHLAFLRSYMTRKPMNAFFPVSVTASVVLATMLGQGAAAQATSAGAAGLAMLATLMVLAILEHWILVVPLPIDALWRWSIRTGLTADPDRAVVPPYRDGTPDKTTSHARAAQAYPDSGLARPLAP